MASPSLEAKLPFAVQGAQGINVPKVAPTAPVKAPTTVASATSSLQPNATGEHMLGTSIMAVAFPGGVVLGADSRTSTGSYVANRVSDKLTPCHDRIYCCRSGSAADTQAIGDMVQYYTDLHALETGSLPLVKSVAAMFADVIYNNKDRLMAGVIVAGWDKKDGGSVYSIPLGGALVRQQFAIGGSGSTYIYGFCDSQWAEYQKRPGGVTQASAQEFVRRALAHAMARDGSSGGVIRMVTITEAGVHRTMIPGDKLDFYGDFEEGPQSTT